MNGAPDPWAPGPDQRPGPGPEFMPPQPPPPPWQPAPPPRKPHPYRPPSRWVASAILIGVVLAVVATMAVSTYLDTRPRPVPTPATTVTPLPVPPNDKTVFFTSMEGRGELELLDQYWTEIDGVTYSMVQVRITSHRGNLSFLLGMFDPSHALVQASTLHSRQPILIHGRVPAGATRTGWAAFPMERGTSTLVMENDLNESVIALRVPA